MTEPLRQAYLLAASAITDDPRVRRMGDGLAARGIRVTAVGLEGGRSGGPDWTVIEAPLPKPPVIVPRRGPLGLIERGLASLLSLPLAIAGALLSAAGSPRGAVLLQIRHRAVVAARPFSGLSRAVNRRLLEAALPTEERLMRRFWRMKPDATAIREAVSNLKGPALWIANDWPMLPIATEAAATKGGIVVYDSHEFALEEFAERPEWRQYVRPVVAHVEAKYIRDARVISSVSPGITAHLDATYRVPAAHLTLRNAPAYQATDPRPTSYPARLLYHGLVSPGRGLEALIESAANWKPGYTLTIRGPASPPDYMDQLAALAGRLGVNARVSFEGPVPMTSLVAAARQFDIGLMALPGHSAHTRFALPNKLFEYMMAGLALAVTDLEEMVALLDATSAGFSLGNGSASAIAAALNALTREEIDRMRAAALDAAKRYNWDTEAAPVIDAYLAAWQLNYR
ncbi:glycosyltransferase [Hyphomonas sp.]|jgi:glycosyltransferase involved in cell wall biosynthesis|uniref:glycosyltransferase n=1 Tax=Hyphomonas sp. TaxID=87 RepID=UPI0037C11913